MKKKTTVSRNKARKIVREIGMEAIAMTGCLHPDEMIDARHAIRQSMSVLYGIIEGKIIVR